MVRVYGNEAGAKLRLKYSPKQIATAVERLAGEISSENNGESILIICVMAGAMIFAADLARQIHLPITMDFIRLSSYHGTDSTGKVTIVNDLAFPIAGKNVLVVEDIVDTGQTLSFLLEYLRAMEPGTLKVCTLLDKKRRRTVDIMADYVGIACEDLFLVGYGLDLDEKYRYLPAIYEVIQ